MIRQAAIQFRRVSAEDVAAVVAIEANVDEPKTYGRPLTLQAALTEIERAAYYLVMKGGQSIGTAAFEFRSDGAAYLSNIALLPGYRNQGFGREVVAFLLSQCVSAPRIELVTHPENLVALSLYRSFGFTVGGRSDNHFGDGEPRLILSRDNSKL